MKTNANSTARLEPSTNAADLAERVGTNQTKLTSELRPDYDFMVFGGPVEIRPLVNNHDMVWISRAEHSLRPHPVRLQLGSLQVARPFRVSAAAQETSNLASDQPEEQLCASIDGSRNA